jgi:hypothetical protein
MILSGEAICSAEGLPRLRLLTGDTVLLPAERVDAAIDLSPGATMLRASPCCPGADRRDGPRKGERIA